MVPGGRPSGFFPRKAGLFWGAASWWPWASGSWCRRATQDSASPRKLPTVADPAEEVRKNHGGSYLWAILGEPVQADTDKSGHIDLKEGTILGLALLLNNLPNGVAAAMIKLPVLADHPGGGSPERPHFLGGHRHRPLYGGPLPGQPGPGWPPA